MSAQLAVAVPEATILKHAADLSSYRCSIRPYQQACEMDPALDDFIQVKAANATAAIRAARLIAATDVIVMSAERLDK